MIETTFFVWTIWFYLTKQFDLPFNVFHFWIDKLENTFGSHLNFIVKTYRNCTSDEIMEVCRKYSGKDHGNFDSIVFCILSHGTTGAVYGSDCRSVYIRDITSCFTASQCQSLASKPKLFFFQACQGLVHQSGKSTIIIKLFWKEDFDEKWGFLPYASTATSK